MDHRCARLLVLIAIILTACTTPTPTPTATDLSTTPIPENTSEPPATPDTPVAPEPTTGSPPIETTGLTRDPVSEADRANAAAIQAADLPISDLRDLAIRFEGLPADTPEKTCTAAPVYQLGDQAVFYAFNSDTLEYFQVNATLVAIEPSVYMWLDNQWLDAVDHDALAGAAREFDRNIVPRDHDLFGVERSPGVDCDPHITILNTSNTASGGYVYGTDDYTRAVRPESNEREMFYVDVEGVGGPDVVGSSYYNGVMAHELQHVILAYRDPNEDIWLNEGMSELAIFLNGDDPQSDQVAAAYPDTQLTDWPEGGGNAINYGTSFSFVLYLWDRYGEAGVRTVTAEPANGLEGIQHALDQLDPGKTLDEIIGDWLVARYLDDSDLGDGRYGYARVDRDRVEVEQTVDSYPFEENTSVNQYAGRYVSFEGGDDITLDFLGSTKARLIEVEPHGGQYYWWSNRGDDANMRLTREIDLSAVDRATLSYWTWFDIETDWDYGYVAVSKDGGATWDTLHTPSGTDRDPINNNLGWGYTGRSGGGETAGWVQEQVDLTPYVGQTVQLRFEVVTDVALNRPGFAVDDIEVPEVGFKDDAESDSGWLAEGWVRTNNFVPQRFIARLISFGRDGRANVTALPLDDDNAGRWEIPLSTLERAVVIVSGAAPKTNERAHFNWTAQQK